MLTEREKESLRRVIQHLADQEQDWLERQKPERHIWQDVGVLSAMLDRKEEFDPQGLSDAELVAFIAKGMDENKARREKTGNN